MTTTLDRFEAALVWWTSGDDDLKIAAIEAFPMLKKARQKGTIALLHRSVTTWKDCAVRFDFPASFVGEPPKRLRSVLDVVPDNIEERVFESLHDSWEVLNRALYGANPFSDGSQGRGPASDDMYGKGEDEVW